MLDSIKGAIAKSYLNKLATDNDTKTTILGFLAAGIIERKLDFGKLFSGDPDQLGNLAFALTVAAIGYYTNKKGKASKSATAGQ